MWFDMVLSLFVRLVTGATIATYTRLDSSGFLITFFFFFFLNLASCIWNGNC